MRDSWLETIIFDCIFKLFQFLQHRSLFDLAAIILSEPLPQLIAREQRLLRGLRRQPKIERQIRAVHVAYHEKTFRYPLRFLLLRRSSMAPIIQEFRSGTRLFVAELDSYIAKAVRRPKPKTPLLPICHGFSELTVAYYWRLRWLNERFRAWEPVAQPRNQRVERQMAKFESNIRRISCAAATAALVLCPEISRADESGISFWLPGLYGSLSATPATPGWSVATIYYHLRGAGARRPVRQQ